MGSRWAETPDLKQCCGRLRQVVINEQFFGGVCMRSGAGSSNPPPDPDKNAQCVALREAVRVCVRCPLHAQRTQAVFGEGDLNAAVMFIGEAPGREEDKAGRPFVGEAGMLLTKIIEAMGLTREQVFITNVLRCRPPDNRPPRPEEEVQCRGHLIGVVRLISPRVICALGTHAAQTLLNEKQPISRLRGIWHSFEGIQLMPTYHPAYLLRSPGDKRLVWQDMKKIMAFVKRESPDKPQ